MHATIVCNNNQTCNIICGNNACNNLNIKCIDNSNANNCSFNIDCTTYNAEQSNICKNSDFINVPSVLFENNHIQTSEFGTFNDAYDTNICNLHNNSINIICNDYQQCEYNSSLLNQYTTHVCCLSREGCYSNNYGINTTLLKCDGYQSCRYINNYNNFITSNGGNIYFSAHYAGFSSIVNANMGDIFCTARSSCSAMILIENINKFYCLGFKSCYNNILMKNIQTLWIYGYQTSSLSTIINIENIYCKGYESCAFCNIINVLSTLFGHGYKVMYNSTIVNVSYNVIGIGYQSLANSKINNCANVCVSHACM